jgi:L-rhamnose mutarotase
MKRYAWKAWIAEGKRDEYIKRHNEIWPEMTEMLNEAGIHNYSIWNTGNELFAYYECEIDHETSMKIQMKSETGKRWNEFMKDILVLETRTGAPVDLVEVFYHK